MTFFGKLQETPNIISPSSLGSIIQMRVFSLLASGSQLADSNRGSLRGQDSNIPSAQVVPYSAQAHAFSGVAMCGPISIAEVVPEIESTSSAPVRRSFFSNWSSNSNNNQEAALDQLESSNDQVIKIPSAPPADLESYLKSDTMLTPFPIEEPTRIWNILGSFNSDLLNDDSTVASNEKLSAEESEHLAKISEAYHLPELMGLGYHYDLHALDGITFSNSHYGKLAAVIHLLHLLASQFIYSPMKGPLTLMLFKKILTQEPYTNFHIFISKAFNQDTLPYFMFALSYFLKARQYTTFSALMMLISIEKMNPFYLLDILTGPKIVEFFTVDRFKFDMVLRPCMASIIYLQRFDLLKEFLELEDSLEYLMDLVSEQKKSAVEVLNMALMVETEGKPQLHEAMRGRIEALIPKFGIQRSDSLIQLVKIRFDLSETLPEDFHLLATTAFIALFMSGKYEKISDQFQLFAPIPHFIINYHQERLIKLFDCSQDILHMFSSSSIPNLMYETRPDLVVRFFDCYSIDHLASKFSEGAHSNLIGFIIKNSSFDQFRCAFQANRSLQQSIQENEVVKQKANSNDLRYYLQVFDNQLGIIKLKGLSVDSVKSLFLNRSVYPLPGKSKFELSPAQFYHLLLDDEVYELFRTSQRLNFILIGRLYEHLPSETVIKRLLSLNHNLNLPIYYPSDWLKNFTKRSLLKVYKFELNQKLVFYSKLAAFESQVRFCRSQQKLADLNIFLSESVDDPEGFLNFILQNSP